MNEQSQELFLKLSQSLEEITKFYRQLLEVVRKEKDFLIQVNQPEIESCYKLKEELIGKIRLSDMLREKYAQNLGAQLNLNSHAPRLLELAQNLPMEQGDFLRKMHSGLELLIKRIQEINQVNQIHAENALKALDGALGNVKETLAGKSTYERKGKYKSGPEQSGHFVSKEA